MNRAERRAAARHKPRQAPQHLNPRNLGALAVIGDVRPYDDRELLTDFIRIRDAFGRLASGSADGEDFARVAVAINLAKLRAMDIDETLADALERAQDAMTACRERLRRHGRYGFDGPGLQSMTWALDAHEEIVRHSSPRQMEHCMQTMGRTLRLQSAMGQRIADDLVDHQAAKYQFISKKAP